MNRNVLRWRQALGVPTGAMLWPHLQRLAERWLRRWGFALWGLVLGLCLVVLADPQAGEDHAQAVQAVARLQQSLAVPEVAVQPEKALPPERLNLLDSLPAQWRRGDMGADWQQVLAAHGLRLQSLRPLPPTVPDGRPAGLPSQAVALRVLGRFEDWARVWAACDATGPVCSLDRISVVATTDPTEVQIDAVLRVWMRAGQGAHDQGEGPDRASGGASGRASGWPGRAVLNASEATDARLSGRFSATLFALDHEGAASSAGAVPGMVASASAGGRGANGLVDGAAGAVGVLDATTLEALPEDPRQWPLTGVRLAGLWQAGADRQAILTTGTRWAQVRLGQRVTREGHRVAVIAQDGVYLRLAQGPLLKLAWLGDPGGDLPKGGGLHDRSSKIASPKDASPQQAPPKDVPSKDVLSKDTSTTDSQPPQGDPR